MKKILLIVSMAVFVLASEACAENEIVSSFNKQLFVNMSSAIQLYKSAKSSRDKADSFTISVMEDKLRSMAKAAMKKLKLLSEVQTSGMEQPAADAINAEKKKQTELVAMVKAELPVIDPSDLLVNHDDYPTLFFKFNLGVQYDSVKTAFSKGHPRLGLLIYDQLYAPDLTNDKGDRGFNFKVLNGGYGIHTFVSALYSSSAEVSTVSNPAPGQSINLADKNAFFFEVPMFIPVYRTLSHARSSLWAFSGPIVLIGGVKTDEADKVDLRKYVGLRTAVNPECYFDFLYGKTESLQGNRFEIRAQMPIYRTTENSLMFIGITANVGTGMHRKEQADLVSTYVSWNVDVSDIFKLFNKTSGQ